MRKITRRQSKPAPRKRSLATRTNPEAVLNKNARKRKRRDNSN